MEIILGKERRRWSEEAKQAMVAETLEPGETVTNVARRRGVNASMLFAWRKQLLPNAAASREAPAAPAPIFMPLAIASNAAAAAAPISCSAPMIELQLVGGAQVKIVGAPDPDLVTAVLKALPRR
jgi:transposase